jgi:hypothetical protein
VGQEGQSVNACPTKDEPPPRVGPVGEAGNDTRIGGVAESCDQSSARRHQACHAKPPGKRPPPTHTPVDLFTLPLPTPVQPHYVCSAHAFLQRRYTVWHTSVDPNHTATPNSHSDAICVRCTCIPAARAPVYLAHHSASMHIPSSCPHTPSLTGHTPGFMVTSSSRALKFLF